MEKAITRRDVLRASAGAAIALPALGVAACTPHPIPETARPTASVAGQERIRIGLIGAGGRGSGAAVQALRADPACVLVSIGDVFADRVEGGLRSIRDKMKEQAAEKVRVEPETTFVGLDAYRKVIDSGVDVVILTEYPAFRPQHLRAAVEAGKHVFAEKPLAVDAPGLRSVLESAAIAERKRLALQVGFCWRYNAGMRAAFAKINSGAIGEVLSVHTDYHTGTIPKHPRQPAWSDLEFQMRNWWHFTWLSGDHIVEQAIHSIDRLSWALGDRLPMRCECLGGRAARVGPESGNVFDHFAAVYEYKDGVRCFHTCRQIDGCPGDNADYIRGVAGSAIVEGWKPIYQVLDRSGREKWSFKGAIPDMYQQEHDELFASIRAGRPINDGVRGVNSTVMAMMGRMAAYSGQTISWEQALASQESLVPDRLEFGPTMEMPPVAVPGRTKFV